MNSELYTLLVDNSNTRTKFALACGGAINETVRTLPTADITPDSVQRTLADWSYSRAVICSVAPQAAQTLRESLLCPCIEISAALCPKLAKGYPNPATLGADRLANAAAAAELYPLPCVAVDLGTACTFDIVARVDGEPRLLGGVIAPGLETLRSGLAARTALLPVTEPLIPGAAAPTALARSTQAALQAGLYHGFRGMALGILEAIARELGEKPYVALTGGDSLLWRGESWVDSIDNTLTFKGMLSIIRQQ